MSSPIVKATIQAAILSAISNVLAQLISCYQAGSAYKVDLVPLGQFITFSLMSCPPNYLWQTWLEATFPGYTPASESGTADSIANHPTVKNATNRAGPAMQALNEKATPAVRAINEKAAPAMRAINEKASAASTAIQDNEVIQGVKRRATDGLETVKAKARGIDARTGISSKASASVGELMTPARRFSTPDGHIIEKTDEDEDQARDKPAGSVKKLNIKNTAIKFSLDQTFGAVINNVLFIAGIGALRGEPLGQIITNVRSDFLPLMLAGQKLWPAVSLISFTLIPVEHRTVFGGIIGVGWGIFLSLVAGGKK